VIFSTNVEVSTPFLTHSIATGSERLLAYPTQKNRLASVNKLTQNKVLLRFLFFMVSFALKIKLYHGYS
jgi:hypothetical protein